MKKQYFFGVLLIIVVIGAALGFQKTDENTKQEDFLTIAAVLPLTGPAAYPGQEAHNGMILALEEINKDEDKIKLIVEDSKTKAAEGVSVVSKLEATDQPDIYITGLSSVSMAVAPLAERYDFPQLAIFTYAPEYTDQNNNTFRFFPTPVGEVPFQIQHLQDLNTQKLGILHLNDDYGNGMRKVLGEAAIEQGIEVVSESFLAPDQDMRTQLRKLMESGIDALYVAGYDAHVVTILNQTHEVGYDKEILAVTVIPQPTVAEQVNPEVLEGIRSAYPDVDKEFTKRFEARFGGEPGIYAPNAYAAIMMLHEITQDQEEITPKNIRKKLLDTKEYPTVLGEITADGREIPFELLSVIMEDGEAVYK